MLVRARAALLLHPPTAYLSHHTSAELHGIPVPRVSDVHLSVPRARDRRERPGLVAHVCQDGRADQHSGLPMSSGPQLFRELAQRIPLVDRVVAGDHMVRHGLVDLSQLVAYLLESSEDGVAPARAALPFVQPKADSVQESMARILLELAGFPTPKVNEPVVADGVVRIPDLSWPAWRLIVEYDGRHHREDLAQWQRDIHRREWFESRGWVVITLTARDLYQDPAGTLERIYAAWLRCGGEPFELSQEWRRHFRTARAA